MLSRLLAVSALAVSAVAIPTMARAAADFPDKPIRLIVPFTSGGGTDILARQVAHDLSEAQKWNVIVENRPGANGSVALGMLARAPADGYQVVLALRENIAITPLLNQEAKVFDALKDFTAIVHVADAPMVIVSSMDSKYDTIQKALDAAKAKPNALTFGTSGQGSMSHLLLALLGKDAHAKMVHVPYKGSSPALSDMAGGHVDFVGGSIASAKSFIDGSRARPLAVSSLTRSSALPNVPTIAELGYKDFNVVTWYGLFGPAGMPPEIVERLNRAVNEVLKTPKMQEVLREQGMQTDIGSPADFDKLFRADYVDLAATLPGLNMAAQ
jgi:tripartite-type tricarboxylate transporter receptor subunit TctC